MEASDVMRQTFWELLQVAIGCKDAISRNPSESEWEAIYQMAVKQSVVGLLFSALERLNKDDDSVKPEAGLFYQWLGEVMRIEAQNRRLDEVVGQLTRIFKGGSLRTCVLKGQGLARLYPEPLRRQSGDVDLWVEGGREDTLRFLKDNCLGIGPVVIHHVDARIIDGIETEIHFLPIWLYNPWYNRRLQRWFRLRQNEQFSNYDEALGFYCPTAEFNVVYCMVHVLHHLLDEGVGLRQVVDYYHVLKNTNPSTGSGQVNTDFTNLQATLRHLGLMKFAGAMMWVLQEICGMPYDWMVCKPNERRGRALLTEIMATGNMGHYDTRFQRSAEESTFGRNLRKSRRWMDLVNYYPSEVVCMPMWKLWHWTWRLLKGYR